MTYTLVADGTSDKVLLQIITWAIKRCDVNPVVAQWFDSYRIPPQPNLEGRLRAALDLYPCDVLFVHRDAEGQEPNLRRREIADALKGWDMRHIPVIPVRMTEAWLLLDELAIRRAAGNPNGTENLNLPDVQRLETVQDPKTVLHDALATASGLNARRRAGLKVRQRVQLIPNYIDDYSRLYVLPAFQMLQRDIRLLFP